MSQSFEEELRKILAEQEATSKAAEAAEDAAITLERLAPKSQNRSDIERFYAKRARLVRVASDKALKDIGVKEKLMYVSELFLGGSGEIKRVHDIWSWVADKNNYDIGRSYLMNVGRWVEGPNLEMPLTNFFFSGQKLEWKVEEVGISEVRNLYVGFYSDRSTLERRVYFDGKFMAFGVTYLPGYSVSGAGDPNLGLSMLLNNEFIDDLSSSFLQRAKIVTDNGIKHFAKQGIFSRKG